MTSRIAWSRAWHTVTFVVVALSMIAELALVIGGRGVLVEAMGNAAPLGVRLLRFFSYFTVQSNLLAAGTALSLIRQPDRDGRTWRVMRVAALVGMTVTFIVYMVALRPLLHLDGTAQLADIGFHYVAPVMTVGGWLLFGPWPRIDTRSLLRHLAWPVGYLVYVLVVGAVSGWYPYPFINAAMLGYRAALLNALVIAVALLVIGATFCALDALLAREIVHAPEHVHD